MHRNWYGSEKNDRTSMAFLFNEVVSQEPTGCVMPLCVPILEDHEMLRKNGRKGYMLRCIPIFYLRRKGIEIIGTDVRV